MARRLSRGAWIAAICTSCSSLAAAEPPAGLADADEDAIVALIGALAAQDEKRMVLEDKVDENLQVHLVAAPDAFFHGTVTRFAEAVRSGSRGRDLIAKLRAAVAEWKPQKDKVLFTLTLSCKEPCFLTGDLRKHIVLAPRSLKLALIDAKPAPRFETWKTFEDSIPGKASLARISTLTFNFTIPRKDARKAPLALAINGIISQRFSGDRHAGINTSSKQISFKSWADVTLPPVTFSFEPARWEGDPPPEFGDLLSKIGEPGAAGAGKAERKAGKPGAPAKAAPPAKEAPPAKAAAR